MLILDIKFVRIDKHEPRHAPFKALQTIQLYKVNVIAKAILYNIEWFVLICISSWCTLIIIISDLSRLLQVARNFFGL